MHLALVHGAPEDEATIRLMVLRDLERGLAEKAPEHVGLLAAIHELVTEAEGRRDTAPAGGAPRPAGSVAGPPQRVA